MSKPLKERERPSDSAPISQPGLPTPRPVLNDLGLLAHYSALPAVEDAGLLTTLDLTKPGNLVKLQNAIAGASISLWDMPVDNVIYVTDLIAHYAEREDEETGEITAGPMLTLIGPDGIWHTGSKFAFRALQLVAMLRGRPPWNPPVALRALRVCSRNKRDFQSIALVE